MPGEPMRQLCLVFIVAALLMLTVSRLALAAWQRERVRNAGGLWPIVRGGWRIDAHEVAVLAVAPAVFSPWLATSAPPPRPSRRYGFRRHGCYWSFVEVATPPFILEYDARPNRLFCRIPASTRAEVSGMLWRGFKGPLVGGLVVVALAAWIGHLLLGNPRPDAALGVVADARCSACWRFAVGILAIRGTLQHRPINPSYGGLQRRRAC